MTSTPIRLLHVSPSFYPAVAYGGPIFSTKAITDGIAEKPDFEVEVLSTDTADPNSKARLDLPENPMILPPGYSVRYCRAYPGTSISLELLGQLPKAIKRSDVIHLTGPYNFPVVPTLILCRLMGKPLVWSARGGFQASAQWADSPKRGLKGLFEKLCGFIRPKNTILHVTAEIEAETSAQNLRSIETALISNSIEIPPSPPTREWQPGGRLRLAFLSRVHPKKGLELLLDAMAKLGPHITLDIYGEGDANYVKILTDQINTLKLGTRVTFHGHVEGDSKRTALTTCDLFVLPTHSENFGIVVAEALSHGTPVITTFNAPWEGLETEDCGLWVEATSEAITDAITKLDQTDLAAMGARGRAWMIKSYSTSQMVSHFEQLYRRHV